MTRFRSSTKRVVYAAFFANLVIAATKLSAAWITDSTSMFSEGIHSIIDTFNQLLLLWGIKRAARPASDLHPFGYGLQLYFWTFIVAVLIFVLGAGTSIYQGIGRILMPHPIGNPRVDYIVLVFCMFFEVYTWRIAFKEFRRTKGTMSLIEAVKCSKDSSVITVLFEDTAALLGLGVAFVCIFASDMLSLPILDGIGSIVIGIILALTAAFLIFELQSLLTGEGVAPATRQSILSIAKGEPGVHAPNEILTMHFGPQDVLVAMSLDFEDTLPSKDIETAVTNIEKKIKQVHPEVTRVFVEAQSFEHHHKN